MRLRTLFFSLFALAGISFAQDTNFATGPQYLITSPDSVMLLRSIATPSLSLGEAIAPPTTTIAAPETTAPPETSPSIGISAIDLSRVYWGPARSNESSVIEISAEPPRNLPASFVDVGVAGTTDVQSLEERGYGVPLGEAARFSKAHRRYAPRVYTNSDLQRLHAN